MPNPVEVVQSHIEAIARIDWATAKMSVLADGTLTLEGVADWEWEITSLYRHVTEAWDFTVADTQLFDDGGGIVKGVILLMNGSWMKKVACEYRVSQDRIVSIILSDTARVERPMSAGLG